jgi:hypothetical protein
MTEGTATGKTEAKAPPKRFFAYCKVERRPLAQKQRELCWTFVAAQGGAIVDEAFDVGAGAVVDMRGYARLYDALDGGTVDAFVTDMTAFGPTMILGLFAVCTVGGVEMWDLAQGRVTVDQIRALGESLQHGLESDETVHDMLGPKKSVN